MTSSSVQKADFAMTAVSVCFAHSPGVISPKELARLVAIGEDDVYQLCHFEEAFTAGIGEEVCARAGA